MNSHRIALVAPLATALTLSLGMISCHSSDTEKRSLAITADALKTITNPIKTKISVMQKIQRSMLTRLATVGRASAGRNLFQREDALLEDAPAMLIIFKLVKAGACRRQQHHVAGLG